MRPRQPLAATYARGVYSFSVFRLAAQYFFIRSLTAFREASDIRAGCRRPASFFVNAPESFATMNESGSSSLSSQGPIGSDQAHVRLPLLQDRQS